MKKDITVGEFLDATEGLTIEETEKFYNENVVKEEEIQFEEDLSVISPPPGMYELSDDEFDIIQGLILSARVQGEKFPEQLMDKFGVTAILDRYVDILRGKQPND